MAMRLASRMERVQLPERALEIGKSVGESEREVLDWPSPDADVLNLTCADTHSFPPAEWVVKEFQEAATGAMPSYTAFRGHRPILESVSQNLGRFLGIEIDPSRELVLTAGTQGGLFAVMGALVETGDSVALLDPDYLSTERTLRFFNANVVHVPLYWHEDSPSIDFDILRKAFKGGSRMFIFSHPNNPTGTVFSKEVIAELADLIEEYDAYVLVDELYSRLVYDGRPFTHLISLPGMRNRCITSIGPSKAESLTGYRIGAVVLPSSLSNAVEDVQAITSIRGPAYSQYILRGWMVDDLEFMDRRRQAYQALRDETVAAFSQLNNVRIRVPGGTSYVFVNVSALNRSDQEVAQYLFHNAHVVINPGYQFGPRGIGNFRICFAQNPAKWGAGLQQITQALRELASK